jgi:hypothetical protein
MIVTADTHGATVVVFACLLQCACGRVETVVGVQPTGSNPTMPDATVPAPPDAASPEPMDATGADEDAGPDDATDSNEGATDSTQAAASACAMPGDGSACVDTLSNIGAGDFHIRFMVTATQTGLTALVNQRASCGYGMFWDLRLNDHVAFETDDGVPTMAGHYTRFDSTNSHVNDGQPHCIVAQRVAGTAAIFVDDAPSGSAPSLAAFRQLAPLVKDSDPCDGEGGAPPTGRDGTKPFTGTIANLCVTSF